MEHLVSYVLTLLCSENNYDWFAMLYTYPFAMLYTYQFVLSQVGVDICPDLLSSTMQLELKLQLDTTTVCSDRANINCIKKHLHACYFNIENVFLSVLFNFSITI